MPSFNPHNRKSPAPAPPGAWVQVIPNADSSREENVKVLIMNQCYLSELPKPTINPLAPEQYHNEKLGKYEIIGSRILFCESANLVSLLGNLLAN